MEEARLALAGDAAQSCNLLVLDEPTNHLDIPAKQMLEDALCSYEGAALLVSDRYFISRVANRIVSCAMGNWCCTGAIIPTTSKESRRARRGRRTARS